MFPQIDERKIPFLTTDQMREVDRAMIEDYGIQLIQMMENAGRNLAELARRRFLNSRPSGQKVIVLAGTGGNGGGGLVCARRLHNWGRWWLYGCLRLPRGSLTSLGISLQSWRK